MIALHASKPLRRIPAWSSRAVLLDFVRAHASDLRIRKARTADGRRGCGARFTFRGEVIEVEAIESPELPDPDDEIVRRCAWLVQRRLGLRTALDDAQRAELERAVLAAAQRGDAETADRLGIELALINEGRTPVAGARARWER